ncbi:MAG TPA: fumarylacetoacetate hydrolase family protein [Candidatus Ventrimonas merdavium]|nr:fumarylacetoacetate hydrolase family protein [Candidatus Ventrimonas merdavium]
MKYVRFERPDGLVQTGVLETDDRIRAVEGDLFGTWTYLEEWFFREEVLLLSPLRPGKIVGVGANYRSFFREKNRTAPAVPRIFLKPSTAVIGPGEPIRSPDPSHELRFEGELGVVIGKQARHVSEEDAENVIFGYTCINDITDWTMLEEDGIWDRGKGSDTFAPIGPCIADRREMEGQEVLLETRVNGIVRQHERTSDMYVPIRRLIAFISSYMTLEPGDVIATGTPAGAGFLMPGDVVEVEIPPIGILVNQLRGISE